MLSRATPEVSKPQQINDVNLPWKKEDIPSNERQYAQEPQLTFSLGSEHLSIKSP
jgi:hypothetical protein